jgi:hypothetical protein
MRASYFIPFIFFLFFFLPGFCQSSDFARVDSFVVRLKGVESLSIPQLSYLLTDPFKNPAEKARAIYTWIAHNITYDCAAFHSASKRKADPKDVYRLRKAVCEGYANLFMEMCNHAGVMCLTIDGYARNGSEIMGEDLKGPNHAWNAVRIGEEWKMIDVTWASGYTDKKVRNFTPQFSSTYFFSDPMRFLFSHYPKLSSWKPPRANLSKAEFMQGPAVLEGYLVQQGVGFSPKKGLIKVKAGEEIRFSFSSQKTEAISDVLITLGEEKKQEVTKPAVQLNGDTISFTLRQSKPGVYPLTIYFHDMATLRYQLEVE